MPGPPLSHPAHLITVQLAEDNSMMQKLPNDRLWKKRITKAARGSVGKRPCHGSRRLDERCSNQSRKGCLIDKGRTMLPITSHGKTVVSLFSPTAAWWDQGGDEVHQLTNQAVKPAALGIMRRAAGRPAALPCCSSMCFIPHDVRAPGAAVVAAAGCSRHRRLGALLSITHHRACLVSLDPQAAQAAGTAACGVL